MVLTVEGLYHSGELLQLDMVVHSVQVQAHVLYDVQVQNLPVFGGST